MQSVKKCNKCKLIKPITEFYCHKEMADGHLNKCKDCARADANRYRSFNLEAYREYDRNRAKNPNRVAAREAYQKTENGRNSINKAKKKFIYNNPLKRKAHCHISNALRDGKVIKPNRCQLCNVECRPEAHHRDYGKPLEIMWLCKKCHVKWHKRNMPLNGDIQYQIEQMKIAERNNTTSFDQ
ncbi:hypothetical protein [Sodalis sp. dw_96]|uniref:hypothetical protein n=1 Tax=Sodalis sp. dw_96 TaxID=2719794 RepID=UPI001BD220A3|nr:hypothetical protein [Sodalis sp. dw_96]